MLKNFLFLAFFALGVQSRPININIQVDTSNVILVEFDPAENLQEYNEVGPIFFQVKQPDLMEHIDNNYDIVYYDIEDNQEYIDSFVEQNMNDLILISKPNIDMASNHSCDICKILVNSIEREIKLGNKTLTEITDMVKHICSLIGGPSGAECEFIIDNLDKIIYYIEHGLNRLDICVILDSCPKNNTNNININSNINDSLNDLDYDNSETNSSCKLCHLLVGVIQKELKLGNKTINDIINIIEDVCKLVGGPDGAECNFIVNSIHEIINYLNKGFDNLKICELLHLCNTSIILETTFDVDNMSSRIGEL